MTKYPAKSEMINSDFIKSVCELAKIDIVAAMPDLAGPHEDIYTVKPP